MIPTDPLWPPYVPVIVVLPTATAVTVPADDTVATSVLLELHVGVTVADVPSLYAAVAVTVVVAPIAKEVAAALTARLVAVAPDTVTVMTAEALCPPTVAVMVAVPGAWAVTVPATSTLATDELLDSHEAFTLALVPSL